MRAVCELGIRGLGVLQGEHLLYSLCLLASTCQRLGGQLRGEPKLLERSVHKSQTPSSPALPLCSSDLRKLTFAWLGFSRRANWLICWHTHTHTRQSPSSYIHTTVVCSFWPTRKQFFPEIRAVRRDRDGPIDQRLSIFKQETGEPFRVSHEEVQIPENKK